MGEVNSIEIPSNETGPEAPMEETVESQATQEGQAEETTIERPDWLPEEFSTPEELAKAYQEQTKVTDETTETTDEPTPIEVFQESNIGQYTNEFNETGDLSNESIEAIANMGIPKQFVEAYVEGQKAMVAAQLNEVFDSVGGEENYNSMLSWAENNLAENEINAFNNIVEGTDANATMLAISGLYSRYTQNNSSAPNLVKGNYGTKNATSAFRSMAEVTAAMKDPRYGKDEAYRKEVEDRLNVSNIF